MSKMNKTERLEVRFTELVKEALRDISIELDTTMSNLVSELVSEIIGQRELLVEIYSKNRKTQDLIENFVDRTFETYIEGIEAIETKMEAIIYLRQSIKNDKFISRYDRMNNSLTNYARTKFDDEKIDTVFYQDLSGYWSFEKVIAFLKSDSVKALYVSEVTRLSRNIDGYLAIVNYAYKNHKKIYLNNLNIVRGSGYLSGLILAIFAEMELLSKQTSFSNYMLEVAQFLNETITFDQIKNRKARKLASLAKFADQEEFITKMIDKAIEVLTVKKADKNGVVKKSSKLMIDVANSVLDEFKVKR